MAEQLYYEDVEIGTEIPALTKHPTTRQLAKWAGATGDWFEIHYDKDFALSQGQPGVLVHGLLAASFLAQLITDWAGGKGWIKTMRCNYRAPHFPSEDLICRGKVTKKYVEGNSHCIDCEIWAENMKGEGTTPGAATVVLPSKGGQL